MRSGAADVLVVGGGVVGCSVAWSLAREGASVVLVEGGQIAGEASGAAAGMLAPLGEAERPGPFLRWGLRALEAFPAVAAALAEASGIDPELRVCGLLRVAGSEEEAAEQRERALRPGGEQTFLDAAAVREREPALTPKACGGLLSPREGHVRSPRLARAYARAAERLGARIEEGVPAIGLLRDRQRVVGVETPAGPRPAGAVVLCTGSWTRVAAAWVAPHLDLPIAPVRGQIVSLDAPREGLSGMLWGRGGLYLVPKSDGSVVVGATTERVGFDRRTTAEGVRLLLSGAVALVPSLAEASFRGAWAGLRPESPDGLPLVGPVPTVDGLFVAAGHYRNGVLLSPVTGAMVADGVLGKGWAEPAFLPERWLRPARSGDAH